MLIDNLVYTKNSKVKDMDGRELSVDARQIILAYSRGEYTAAGAAWELWHRKLTPFDDPRAGDVIQWSRDCGYGIPDPPDAQVEDEVRRALDMIRGRQKNAPHS